MRSISLAAAAAAVSIIVAACGGYGGPAAGPTGPSDPTAVPPDAVVINIVGINGAQSFSPNPATIPLGKTVVWHNTDSTTHHVMLDDGELDTGNIAPGQFSRPLSLVGPGPYHCSIHPEMIGRVQVP